MYGNVFVACMLTSMPRHSTVAVVLLFHFFHPSMIISLHLSIVMVTLVVELVFEIAYHVMLSLSVTFSFLSVIFLGTSSEVWPIPLAFVVYQSWPLGNLGLTGLRIGKIRVRMMQIRKRALRHW